MVFGIHQKNDVVTNLNFFFKFSFYIMLTFFSFLCLCLMFYLFIFVNLYILYCEKKIQIFKKLSGGTINVWKTIYFQALLAKQSAAWFLSLNSIQRALREFIHSLSYINQHISQLRVWLYLVDNINKSFAIILKPYLTPSFNPCELKNE